MAIPLKYPLHLPWKEHEPLISQLILSGRDLGNFLREIFLFKKRSVHLRTDLWISAHG